MRLESENMSEHSQGAEAVEDLKMIKQCGNVLENKGALFYSSRRSGNAVENKGGYAQNAEILLKRKGVIGIAELQATCLSLSSRGGEGAFGSKI
jgi:hypothetical protein